MAEDKGLTRSQREEKVLQFWKENKVFEKTLEKESPKGEFIFYEGPPTANAKPALHHMEARFFKDAIPRYKTMRGYKVPRRAGWDTHGLPVELQIEKKLGFSSKKDIEAYGIEKFNKECRESVFQYIADWEKFTERIGYWVDFKDAYFTFDNSYIESVWKIISHVEKRGLLYKDYKIVPWCPRCGTGLSSHELAQGYQDVKDISLYAKFKVTGEEDTYFIAWTTTPWTLPGNLALAVGNGIEYVKFEKDGARYIASLDFYKKGGNIDPTTELPKLIETYKGSELVGMRYEPLYNFVTPNDKTFRVYAADFVNTEDGTGIVHTAVMYGQDDFELGTEIGLPKAHLVSPDATFVKGTDWLEGKSVVEESTAVEILKNLQERGLLFKKESYTHSYPFCWRCKTRLIYYARDSWYIRMSKLRDELVKENEKINWEPDHIKEGRFGEWLREVKDWSLSRERYWGTPLPAWLSEDGDKIVVDSVKTLKKYTKTNGNKFIFVRHGEAEHNVKNVCNSDPSAVYHLTKDGKVQAEGCANRIKKADVIYTSPFVRTKETAAIIASKLGIKEITEDSRLVDLDFGEFNGKPFNTYLKYEEEHIHTYDTPLPGGESYNDAKKRFGEFLYEVDGQRKNQTIVVVTHGIGIETAAALIEGAGMERSKEIIDTISAPPGKVMEFDFIPLPHNDNFELDLHKPYIDDVVLMKNGKKYRRTKEVMDVWLDSGAMPFAQNPKDIKYPADFISEAIDQTRGWFYTLHAIGVLMGKGRSYKNVICLGHILDKEGKKMSKSVGNVVEPFEAIEKYGADTLRLWMYSVNQPGESKNFDERTVDEVNKRIFNLLDNVFAFYELYRDRALESDTYPESKNVLDRWVLAKLTLLVDDMSAGMDSYKLLEPVRAMREFINDLSTWYLRRSRDRLKSGDADAKRTLYYALKTVSKLLAPFAPFASEELFQKLRTEKEVLSVHLLEWPTGRKLVTVLSMFSKGKPDEKLLSNMEEVRRLVSLALEARSRANVKIRQPLLKLESKKLGLSNEFIELIKDEVNVKEVLENPSLAQEVLLDISLTPELIEEGEVREIIRGIQDMRKERGLNPGDLMQLAVPQNKRELYEKHAEAIKRATNVSFGA